MKFSWYGLVLASNPASFFIFFFLLGWGGGGGGGGGGDGEPGIHCLHMRQFLNYIINKRACDDKF